MIIELTAEEKGKSEGGVGDWKKCPVLAGRSLPDEQGNEGIKGVRKPKEGSARHSREAFNQPQDPVLGGGGGRLEVSRNKIRIKTSGRNEEIMGRRKSGHKKIGRNIEKGRVTMRETVRGGNVYVGSK